MELTTLVYVEPELKEAAQHLADRFALPCIDGCAMASAKPKFFQRFLKERCPASVGCFVFVLGASGLALNAVGDDCSIRADFHGPTVTYRRKQGGGKGQMIAKAVGLRSGVSPRVLDATAGLGGDAFVLASLGCSMTMLERVPAVRALLQDGLAQARRFVDVSKDRALEEVLDRMSLVETDALDYMQQISSHGRPDVVYLDPMFPVRNKSALVKKEMRLFHHLVGADADADGLLDAALSCARYRVVVKRARIASPLSGRPPSYVLEGKSNRYDVYALEKLPDGLNLEV